MHLLIISLFLIVMSLNPMQESRESTTLRAVYTSDFDITGNGSAGNWEKAEWVLLPQRSFEGIKKETRVKILYSDKGIYFLFLCEDEKLTATMTEDNLDLWTEDVIEVFLWTDENYPLYFEYELSPLNYQLPLLIPNFDGRFLGWIPWHYVGDRVIIHATSVQGGSKEPHAEITSWTGEFFIPYAILEPLNNVPPKKGMKWRINMYRNDYDTGYSVWTWQPVDKSYHEFEKFGTLLFD